MCSVQPSKDSKGWGFINKSGKLVISAIYKTVYSFENGVCAVSTEESGYETALLNKEGIMVGDYTFRLEYLRLTDMDIYAVDMYNQK